MKKYFTYLKPVDIRHKYKKYIALGQGFRSIKFVLCNACV